MQSKISNIQDHIYRYEFQMALTEINKIVSKDKNKSKITEQEQLTIQILQQLCNAKIYKYGDADKQLTEFISKNKYNKDFHLNMINSVAFPLQRIKDSVNFVLPYYQTLEKDKDNKIVMLNNYIRVKDFSGAAQMSNKLYIQTKEPQFMMQYIFLSFQAMKIEQKSKGGPLDKKKLDLLIMFLTSKTFKELKVGQNDCNQLEIANQAVRLLANIRIEQKEFEKAIEVIGKIIKKYNFLKIEKYPNSFKTNQGNVDFLNKILEFQPENNQILQKLITNYLNIFRTNLNLEKFEKIYMRYEDFLKLVKSKVDLKKINLENIGKQAKLDQNQQFEEIKEGVTIESVLEQYVGSLEFMYTNFIELQSKHNFYKDGIKCSILALINSYYLIGNSNNRIQALYDKYTELFANTLTFPEEVNMLTKDHLQFRDRIKENLKNSKGKKVVDECIIEINNYKIDMIWTPAENFLDDQFLEEKLQNYLNSYKKYMGIQEIYPDGKIVEKGERLWPDDFLFLAADATWPKIFSMKNVENKENLKFIYRIILILESGFKLSPFNFDIQIRLIFLYNLISNTDRFYEIYRLLDVKGIQNDTISYLYFNPLLNFSLIETNQDFIDLALACYAENNKEPSETIISSMKSNNYETIDEFLEFEDWINQSYTKYLIYFVKAVNFNNLNKKQNNYDLNIEYLLKTTLKKLQKVENLTNNTDFKISQPIVGYNSKFKYFNYFEVFNNPQYLETHSNSQLNYFKNMNIEDELSNEKVLEIKEIVSNLKNSVSKIKNEEFFDFSKFQIRKKESKLIKYSINYQNDENIQLQNVKIIEQLGQKGQMLNYNVCEAILAIVGMKVKETPENILKITEFAQEGNQIQSQMQDVTICPVNISKQINYLLTFIFPNLVVLTKNMQNFTQKLKKLQNKNKQAKEELQKAIQSLNQFQEHFQTNFKKTLQIISEKLGANQNSKIFQLVNLILELAKTHSDTLNELKIDPLAKTFQELNKVDIVKMADFISESSAANWMLIQNNLVQKLTQFLKD